MARKQKDARQWVWLECTETGDLNYRTVLNLKGGMPEKFKGAGKGLMKYNRRLRKHTLHKIKR